MNPIYRDLVLARIRGAIEEARAVHAVKHPGLRGRIREVLVDKLFQPLLPSGFGTGSGKVISADGSQSRQQDIIIFNRGILAPISFEGSVGMFPVESVIYTIEVKSRLTAKGLRAAHESARELAGFRYSRSLFTPNGKPRPNRTARLNSALMAFGTDLKAGGKGEIQRYQEIYEKQKRGLIALCVVGKGYWYFYKDHWISWDVRGELDEVAGFLSGVMNTIAKISGTRGQPNLGRYLL